MMLEISLTRTKAQVLPHLLAGHVLRTGNERDDEDLKDWDCV